MRRVSLVVTAAVLAVAVIGCAPASPAPSPSATASGGPAAPAEPVSDEPTGWLVEATTSLFSASGRLCPDDGFVITPDDPEWGAFYTEINGGPPDSWSPGDPWEIDDGVTLDVAAGIYYFNVEQGGDIYELSRGDLSVQFDAQGRTASGSGSGVGRVITSDGDVLDFSDSVAFTVTPTAVPAWCEG